MTENAVESFGSNLNNGRAARDEPDEPAKCIATPLYEWVDMHRRGCFGFKGECVFGVSGRQGLHVREYTYNLHTCSWLNANVALCATKSFVVVQCVCVCINVYGSHVTSN